jgi:Mg-chelatase subunit ChlD
VTISFVYPHYLWLLLLLPLIVGLALAGKHRPSKARFWTGLVLRSLLLALIVLSLAGIQLRLRVDTLTVVFVLDLSDSLPKTEQTRGQETIREAITSMPSGDKAAIVAFGKDALVERLASEERSLPDIASVPVSTRTNIHEALQLAMALFPQEGAKRLILLSDGRENVGHVLEQAELAATHGIELTYMPLSAPSGEAEVLVDSLEAPTEVRQGQDINLTILIRSSLTTDASLRIYADGLLLESREVSLQPGDNRFVIPIKSNQTSATGSVFRRFRVQIVPDVDTRLQNNEASAYSIVHGPPVILVVEGQPGESANLAQALRTTGMQVAVILPGAMPLSLGELAAYDSVILANVPAEALPAGVMDVLQVYVRDLGKGLMMTGGETAFGAGGYLRTPLEVTLPVDMDVRSKEQTPNLALVLAVDKSGSMGRCHCDNPDINQTYTRREVGQPKVDIAKAAILNAASALGNQDYLGVIAFDSVPHWALEMHQLVDTYELEKSIGTIQANGQTNLQAGVQAAYDALEKTDAHLKHVILLTDGWVRTGDLTALASKMRDQGITLSIVAAGQGSAEYLKALAMDGGGRYYPATDILRIPEFFLKETVKSVGQYIVEEAFYPLPSAPSAVLQGFDLAALPPLLGYNGTTPKPAASVILTTPRGDPLLATWQYGLGRAVAWTSDLKGQWATKWVTWEGFASFVAQVINWTLPAPQVEGIDTQISEQDGLAVIQATIDDQNGEPLNFLDVKAALIDPEAHSTEITLPQVGAGQYEAKAELTKAGTYLAHVIVKQGDKTLGGQTLGLVVPYSPEYKASGTNLPLLKELARATGGGELGEPATVFLHNLPASEQAHEIWNTLLLAVVLLFPLDVALRRVMLGPGDVHKAIEWIKVRFGKREGGVVQERILAYLFRARDRARRRAESAHPIEARVETRDSGGYKPKVETRQRAQGESTLAGEAPQCEPPYKISEPESSQEGTLERLRAAKKRARREKE